MRNFENAKSKAKNFWCGPDPRSRKFFAGLKNTYVLNLWQKSVITISCHQLNQVQYFMTICEVYFTMESPKGVPLDKIYHFQIFLDKFYLLFQWVEIPIWGQLSHWLRVFSDSHTLHIRRFDSDVRVPLPGWFWFVCSLQCKCGLLVGRVCKESLSLDI